MLVLKLIRIVLALTLMAAPAMAETVTLDGTVTYRERIALPQGAQLRISLVALPSGAAIVGASSDIPVIGQVPLAFSLNIRSKLTGDAYGLVAEIRSGGHTLFRNAAPVPVDPYAALPVHILLQSV